MFKKQNKFVHLLNYSITRLCFAYG